MIEREYDYLFDMYVDEHEDLEERKESWSIKNDGDAEWLIDRVNEDLVEINRYEMAIVNKIEILKEKLDKVRNEKEYKINRRNGYLLQYFEKLDDRLKKVTKTQEKYRLPSGEIIKKYPSVEYKRDNDLLVAWVKDSNLNEFIEVKESAKWADLKKKTKLVGKTLVFEDTGEVIEGVEVIERPPVIEFKEV